MIFSPGTNGAEWGDRNVAALGFSGREDGGGAESARKDDLVILKEKKVSMKDLEYGVEGQTRRKR
jgi:hypothetical protein